MNFPKRFVINFYIKGKLAGEVRLKLSYRGYDEDGFLIQNIPIQNVTSKRKSKIDYPQVPIPPRRSSYIPIAEPNHQYPNYFQQPTVNFIPMEPIQPIQREKSKHHFHKTNSNPYQVQTPQIKFNNHISAPSEFYNGSYPYSYH